MCKMSNYIHKMLLNTRGTASIVFLVYVLTKLPLLLWAPRAVWPRAWSVWWADAPGGFRFGRAIPCRGRIRQDGGGFYILGIRCSQRRARHRTSYRVRCVDWCRWSHPWAGAGVWADTVRGGHWFRRVRARTWWEGRSRRIVARVPPWPCDTLERGRVVRAGSGRALLGLVLLQPWLWMVFYSKNRWSFISLFKWRQLQTPRRIRFGKLRQFQWRQHAKIVGDSIWGGFVTFDCVSTQKSADSI